MASEAAMKRAREHFHGCTLSDCPCCTRLAELLDAWAQEARLEGCKRLDVLARDAEAARDHALTTGPEWQRQQGRAEGYRRSIAEFTALEQAHKEGQ